MIYIFKCPHCSGEMDYDITVRKLVCRQCRQGVPMHAYDIQDMQFANEESSAAVSAEEQDLSAAVCPACGAEILMGKYEISGSCAFCGSDIVIDRGGKKNLIPERIIPFQVNKAQISCMIQEWWRKNAFAPKIKIKEQDIQMVYIPVWLMDFSTTAEMEATVSRTQIQESPVASTYGLGGQTSYQNEKSTVYSYSNQSQTVHKKVEAFVRLLPHNASGKVGQTRFRSIEPFDYNELQMFHPGYLDGIAAERYYYPPNETVPSAREMAEQYTKQACKERVLVQAGALGYLERVNMERADSKLEKIWYALLPIAMYTYHFHGKKYTLYVNGQTGKVGGEVPISNRRKVPYFLGAMLSMFIFLLGAAYSLLIHTNMDLNIGKYLIPIVFYILIMCRLIGESPGKENRWNFRKRKINVKTYTVFWMLFFTVAGAIALLSGLQYTGYGVSWRDEKIMSMWGFAVPFALVMSLAFAVALVKKLVRVETDLTIAKAEAYIAPYSVREIV